MTQRSQIIDITKSYFPGDPNTFVQTLVNTDREDGEEKTLPVLAYEGYNFLPTAYGYKSYFGTTTELDIALLDKKVQFVLSYQLSNYQTRLIALCADGIWVCNANIAASVWVHSITLTDTPTVFEEWTWCIIENILYMYRQGQATAWKTGEAAGEITISTHTPNFITMAAQMGIFRAKARLGFWDADNAVHWSSNLDLTNFTPSLEDLTGNTTFADIIGRIISIRAHGEGYIIYSSRSITGVTYNNTGNMLWDGKKIFDNIGISYSRAVTYGQNDNEHFVYSTSGFYRIGKFNALNGKHDVENIAPEVYDFLKKSRDAIYLDTINSRYIFFNILNPDYVYGLTSFDYVSPEDLNVQFLIGGRPWDGQNLPAICIDGNAAAEAIRQLVTFAFVRADDSTALWTAIATETQDGTIGPLDVGGGRAAQTPGFTTQNIIDTYILGTTLPAELTETTEEHTDISQKYLGNYPTVDPAYAVSGAQSQSLVMYMYKQKQDWELFRQHQAASVALIAAATKVVNTPGVVIAAYLNLAVQTTAELPALPANTTEDTVAGNYKTGEGNIEIQLDKPLRKLVMRKYFQEKYTVTRRKVTTYAWRQGTAGSVAGKYKSLGNLQVSGNGGGYIYVPDPLVFSQIRFSGIDNTAVLAGIDALLIAQSPATTTQDGVVKNFSNARYSIAGTGDVVVSYTGGNGYIVQGLGSPADTNLTPYYQDKTETYSYIVSAPITAAMGSYDFSATQSDTVHTIINVTSVPPTIVVTSLVPIFPTGPSAITFFPPTWEGEETLKLIAASALSPWHLASGEFGAAIVGDLVTGTEAQLTSLGGCALYGNGFIGADYGLTYSSFPYILQVGSPFIYYPTFAGSLVLDLALKKWGKMKNNFQVLIDLQPLNQFNPTILTADEEGMDAALHLVDETIKIFDDMPADSLLRYGKIGSYRLGITKMLETRIQNGKACTGILSIDSSLDGRNIDSTLHYEVSYTSARVVEGYPDISARWHIVTVSGNYDLTGLEVRTIISGRR